MNVTKKEKIKPLSPSLRERKRYLAFEIISSRKFDFKQVHDTILYSVKHIFGIIGLSSMGLIIIKNKYNNNIGIIRVSHKYLDHLRFSLSMIKKIDNTSVIFKSLNASGILKKAKKMNE